MSKELVVSKEKQTQLEEMSLEELAKVGNSVNKQAKLMLGMVLLESRTRFPSNNPFGQWCSDNFGDVDVRSINNLVNLAKFFKDRPMENIGLSVGYILSAPAMEEHAEEAYESLIKIEGKVTVLAAKKALADLSGGKPAPVPLPTPPVPDSSPEPDPKPEIETWEEREEREEREQEEREDEPFTPPTPAPQPRERNPDAVYQEFLDAYDSLPDDKITTAKQYIMFGESFEEDKDFKYRIKNYIGIYAMLGVTSGSTHEAMKTLYTHYSMMLRKEPKLIKALKASWIEEFGT